MKPATRVTTSFVVALSMAIGTCDLASASQTPDPQSSSLSCSFENQMLGEHSDSVDMQDIDTESAEELFTKYISLDNRNFMHLNKEAVLNSPYRENVNELLHFTGVMNDINANNLDIRSRDGWSFAKCVIADAVGVNMVSRLTKGLYTAIRAAQWPLAAKTILQIAGSAGLNLGWKANAVGLAIALGKSAIYCRNKW